MNSIQTIVDIASILTSLGVLIAAIIAGYKFIRKWDKWIAKKDKHDMDQYIQILRLVIMTPEMPLSERIAAGDIYVHELEKNGAVKQKYNELLLKFKNEHSEE